MFVFWHKLWEPLQELIKDSKHTTLSWFFFWYDMFSFCRKDSLDSKVSNKHSDEVKRERLASVKMFVRLWLWHLVDFLHYRCMRSFPYSISAVLPFCQERILWLKSTTSEKAQCGYKKRKTQVCRSRVLLLVKHNPSACILAFDTLNNNCVNVTTISPLLQEGLQWIKAWTACETPFNWFQTRQVGLCTCCS